MNQIEAIRKSLAAFVCGWLSLLPLIGFVPALYAIGCRMRVRTRFQGDWNPAAKYLAWGAVLGWIGLLNSIGLAVVLGIALIESLIG